MTQELPTPDEQSIKNRCACVHSDPHECYFHRYAPMDDLQRAEFETEMRATGDECECGCHGDEWYDDGEEDYL